MSNFPSSRTLDERDEYPHVIQRDLDRARFRAGLEPVPRKRRITISLDTGLVEYFRGKAGKRGYQALVNDTLWRRIEREDLEERLRRIIREELHSETL